MDQRPIASFVDTKGTFVIPPGFESARDFSEGVAAVRQQGRWGFVDKVGAFAIGTRFEQVHSFREGLAGVKIDGKWGFVNSKGEIVIQPQFEGVEQFSQSMALVNRNGQLYFVDRSGDVKLGPFRAAGPFVHGLAPVRTGSKMVRYIDQTGATIFKYSWKPRISGL